MKYDDTVNKVAAVFINCRDPYFFSVNVKLFNLTFKKMLLLNVIYIYRCIISASSIISYSLFIHRILNMYPGHRVYIVFRQSLCCKKNGTVSR